MIKAILRKIIPEYYIKQLMNFKILSSTYGQYKSIKKWESIDGEGNKIPWLIPIPVILMRFVAKLVGKSDVTDRLFGSLQVDSSKARDLLDWKPVTTMDEQLQKTALAFLSKK